MDKLLRVFKETKKWKKFFKKLKQTILKDFYVELKLILLKVVSEQNNQKAITRKIVTNLHKLVIKHCLNKKIQKKLIIKTGKTKRHKKIINK